MKIPASKILLALIVANTCVSAAFAQIVTGSIGISCPTGANQPSMIINDGVATPASLEFEPVSGAGRLNNPIRTGTQFKLSITDARGYDAGTQTCGPGFDIVLQADTSTPYFLSQSGNNNTVLAMGNDSNNCLTIQGTDWDTNPNDVGLFTIAEGSEISGLNESNVQGAPQTELNFTGNNLTAPIATITESFEGTLDIIFEGDDLNLDIPAGIPVDRYTKSMVLSLS